MSDKDNKSQSCHNNIADDNTWVCDDNQCSNMNKSCNNSSCDTKCDQKDNKCCTKDNSCMINQDEVQSLKDKINTYDMELNTLKLELNEAKTEQLRLKAQILTERRTQELNKEQDKKLTLQRFAKDLVQSLYTLDIALEHSQDHIHIASGINMIKKQVYNVLNKYHIEEINTKVEDIFDSKIHECLEKQHSDTIESNHIIKIISSGFKLHDIILKPVHVIIAE